MEELISLLKNRKETVATMESCTGGMLASEITNIAGSSDVFHCSLVTYSSAYKVKFGVKQETINTYTVYSTQTADEMAKVITSVADADWGIGITGYLGDVDPDGILEGKNIVYYSIYNRKEEKIKAYILEIPNHLKNRKEKKEYIIRDVIEKFKKQLH